MSDIRTHTAHATHPHHQRPSRADMGDVFQAIGSLTSQQRSLQDQLQNIIASSQDMGTAAEKTAMIASSIVNASFISFVTRGDERPLDAIATVGNIDSAPTITYPFLQSLCLQVIEQDSSVAHSVGPDDPRTVVCMPIQLGDSSRGAVVALLESDNTPIAKRMLIMELVSYALQQWDTKQAVEHLNWEASTASAITELIGQIETCPSHQHACLLATNTLNTHFQARQSAIGFVGRNASITLRSISGKAEFDHQSDLAQRITAAMDETLVRDDVTAWPPLSVDDRHATLNHRKLAEHLNAESILSVPLKTVAGTVSGVWLSTGTKANLHDQRHVTALRTIAPYLATSLTVRKAADPGMVRAAWQNVTGQDALVGRTTLATAALLFCLVPFIPVKHRIKSMAVIEPAQHRYITVPFDGTLKETFVRPGDQVASGQLLAVMDDLELGWLLDKSLAEINRAGKKRDAAMASHENNEAQIAKLEVERLQQEIEVLRHRQQNLKIKASLDGFILKGDLEEVHGAPVTIGQSLFEIAPLSPLKLEVAVPEDEIAYVDAGMTVNVRLDGHPQGTISGTIDKLHPRSEIRDNRNVFIAEVTLENKDHQLRPGMSGRARVVGERKLLGWVWLHKAVYRVRSAVGV